MMFNGYPICPALTSLVLLASLALTPPSVPRSHGCSDIGRFYSSRILREVRARLMLAYAESHARRAADIAAAIRNHAALQPAVQKDQLLLHPQESDDPKLKHLLAYIAMNCL
jgi:hypothetical protein